MSQALALMRLLMRHWARASLPNRLRKSTGRRASAGIFRLAYVGLMSASGFGVGRTVSTLALEEQRIRGAAWMVLGVLGLAIVWSGLTRGPTLRGEPSPLETPFLDALPIRETNRLAVGLVERLFVYALAVAAFAGVARGAVAFPIAFLVATLGVAAGEAGMRIARVIVPAMTVAKLRSYLLVGGQIVCLMMLVQAPSLARSPRISALIAGWPSKIARALLASDDLLRVAGALIALIVLSTVALGAAERIGYDKIDVTPTARPRRTKREALVIERIDEVLRRREPGGRWSTLLMAGYTSAVSTGIVAYAWSVKNPTFESSSMIRLACGVAAFGSFVVVTARASRMASRDVAARPLLAPLPIEPRALLAGKVTRLRRDAMFVCIPLLVLFATPWTVALHVEVAWRVASLFIAAALAAKAAASIAFLTVGAGSRRGPMGGFVVESVLVLVPFLGVATATIAWATVVPLLALGFVAREAGNSALGCVRWIDDADDFERETPIWRALLVLAAFQSTANLTERLVDMSGFAPGVRLAVQNAASAAVLLAMTLHGRREAPSFRLRPERGSMIVIAGLAGLATGGVAYVFRGPPPEERWLLAAIAIAVTPIAEEVFFRGWLLPCIEDELAPGFRRKWLTPLLGSFAFAAAHPIGDFVPLFALGLATSMLFLRSRALLPCVVAHVLHAIVVR
jgi:membrane protease YdiL (CAAX protease family)